MPGLKPCCCIDIAATLPRPAKAARSLCRFLGRARLSRNMYYYLPISPPLLPLPSISRTASWCYQLTFCHWLTVHTFIVQENVFSIQQVRTYSGAVTKQQPPVCVCVCSKGEEEEELTSNPWASWANHTYVCVSAKSQTFSLSSVLPLARALTLTFLSSLLNNCSVDDTNIYNVWNGTNKSRAHHACISSPQGNHTNLSPSASHRLFRSTTSKRRESSRLRTYVRALI
jgi:hypothetical protein